MTLPKVLKNGTVITFDEQAQAIKVLPRASVLIIDQRIAAIEVNVDNLVIPHDAEIIDVAGKIVSPGFVNTHCHMWQTAYRTIAPNVTLPHYFDWLSQVGETVSTAFTPEDVYISSLEGYLEGLNGGVTSYVDHADINFHLDTVQPSLDATIDSGARSWWCWAPVARKGISLEEQWKHYEKIATNMPKSSTASLGLAYDGSAGASDEEFEQIKRRIKDLKVQAITIHHLGGPWPADASSPSQLAKRGLADQGIPIIVSHASFLTSEDMDCLRKKNMHISIAPESEFHYGHGQEYGHLVSDQASIGVDTTFTFSGDIKTQARIWLQKVRDYGYQKFLRETGLLPANTPLTVEQGFLLATRQGGRALWRDDIGVLKVGAKADVAVFNGDSPNMLGWSNAVAAVLLHANVGDIQHVLVDGEFRKRDFELVNMKHDWAVIRQRFLATAKRLQEHAMQFQPPVPEKLWGFKATGHVEEYSTIRRQ